MRRWLLAVVACVPAVVHAQPTAPVAQAEVLFRQGRELMEANRFAEACVAFEASQRLDPTIGTLLNHASCREKNGQLATAWGLFLEAARTTRSATDDTTRGFHLVAIERSQKLEPRVSKLTISVSKDSHIDHLALARDGQRIDEVMWNRTLPIDGGTYTITARAPGSIEWSAKVTVGAEGDTKTVDVPKLQSIAVVPMAPTTPVPPVRSRSHVVPFVVGAGSLVVLGGALGLEISARSVYAEADPARETDPVAQDRLWDKANTRRHVAQGLTVAGVAGVGVAVWLHLRQRGPAPVITRDGVALLGRF